jgi:hypothetical protein
MGASDRLGENGLDAGPTKFAGFEGAARPISELFTLVSACVSLLNGNIEAMGSVFLQ